MIVCTAVHACKQMGLEANFKEAKQALDLRMLYADVARQAYAEEHNATKKKKGNTKGEVEGPTPFDPETDSRLAKTKAAYE